METNDLCHAILFPIIIIDGMAGTAAAVVVVVHAVILDTWNVR
jgi:hypothetical protein